MFVTIYERISSGCDHAYYIYIYVCMCVQTMERGLKRLMNTRIYCGAHTKDVFLNVFIFHFIRAWGHEVELLQTRVRKRNSFLVVARQWNADPHANFIYIYIILLCLPTRTTVMPTDTITTLLYIRAFPKHKKSFYKNAAPMKTALFYFSHFIYYLKIRSSDRRV